MSKSIDFTGKTILITGSTKGIGTGLVKGFSALGAHVILHGRNPELTQKLAEELNTDYVLAKLDSHEDVEHMIATLNSNYSKLDVLINNAGYEVKKPFEEYSMDEFDQIFSVNIRSVFHLTKGVFPLLKAANGASVINMSSIHQKLPYPENLVYSMAKAAMGMFSEVVGIEWAPYNIRVNSLAPGAILTPMNEDLIENLGKGLFSSWIGSGKIGEIKDVLNACIYLGSDMSNYMTGETLYLDGGLSRGLLPYGKTPAMHAMIAELINKDKEI